MSRASRFLLFALASLGLAAAGCKKSEGFEGEITLRIGGGGGASEMVFTAAGDRVRLDLSMPNGKRSHTLVRPDGKAVLVVDDEKAWTDMDLTKAASAVSEADPMGNPTVLKTGKHETIAGHDCEIWNITHANGKRTESCIAEGLAAFDFGALLPGASLLRPSSPAASEMHQRKLFPLRSIEIDASGKETSRMEVTRIERKKIDGAKFEIPANYTKIERP